MDDYMSSNLKLAQKIFNYLDSDVVETYYCPINDNGVLTVANCHANEHYYKMCKYKLRKKRRGEAKENYLLYGGETLC